jgi:hypothetical protein
VTKKPVVAKRNLWFEETCDEEACSEETVAKKTVGGQAEYPELRRVRLMDQFKRQATRKEEARICRTYAFWLL